MAQPKPAAAETCYAAALAAARRGFLDKAETVAQTAAASCDPDSPLGMRISNLRGAISFERGCLERAEEWFEETLRLARALGDDGMAARVTNNLASIAHLRGKNSLTLSLYQSALLAHQRRGDVTGEAQTSHNLGLVYRELGQLDSAAEFAERAVRAAAASGDRGLLGLCLLGRAEIAVERGDSATARSDIRRAKTRLNATKDRIGAVEAVRVESLLALRQGKYLEALGTARRGYRAAGRLGSTQLLGECAALSALASRRLKRHRLAERYHRTAVDCFSALGARPALRRLGAGAGD